MRHPAPPDDPTWRVLPIWKEGAVAGNHGVRLPETRTLDEASTWRGITSIQNVFLPTMTIIAPNAGVGTGASMLILPGGGFGMLAWDIEGAEVGRLLAGLGVTAFVLKYRVQKAKKTALLSLLARGIKRGVEPLIAMAAADAMQAVRVVRELAPEIGLDPQRVGMIGFSAGAMTTLRVLQDAGADARPDFAASIYGMLWDKRVRPQATPLLIAAAHPDPTVADVPRIGALWAQAGAPHETHIFESGGHGFGLGQPGTDSERFPGVFANWLIENGIAADPSKLTRGPAHGHPPLDGDEGPMETRD